MKSILVPIDFSKDSMNALDHAIAMANKVKSSIRIIHVRKDKNYDEPFVIKGKEKEYGNTVDDFCKELIEQNMSKYKGGGTFDYLIKVGKIYKVISDQAIKDKAFLIIMGTHGVSGFEEFWLGSNSYRVVCKAPCPVLTVRNGFKKKSINKIVLPLDASRETRKKVPYVADLASALEAEVHVVSVRTTQRADIKKRLNNYVNQIGDYFEKRNIQVVKNDLHGSDISDLATSYGVHIGAELVAIMSNQRGTPLNMHISTAAQQMVNHCPIPVLSIHPSYLK
ncbi:MAG: universal stress protein [Bacteroidota bacterium]|nr:universal stress protein [Bacteroidota bacterium]